MPRTQIFQVNVSYAGITANQWVHVDVVDGLKDSVAYARCLVRTRIRKIVNQSPVVNFVKLSHEVIDGEMIDCLHQQFVG